VGGGWWAWSSQQVRQQQVKYVQATGVHDVCDACQKWYDAFQS
jgi:hypothetical protein